MSVRTRLETRFRAEVARARGARELDWPEPRLPAPLVDSMVVAAALDGGDPPEELASYYCDKMPRLLVEQLTDPALAPWINRPIERARWPRLAAALDGLYDAFARAGVSAEPLLGARSAAALLAARPSIKALYAETLFGSGLPLTGAYPHERARLGAELEGADPEGVLDLRLSGHLMHELCHGPPRAEGGAPAPWLIVEAAALHLGAEARAAHVFPDQPGEAVPGVARFVLVGEALAARFGAASSFGVLAGAPLGELFGARVAAALDVAGWQDWLARRQAPFARDAEAAHAWIKLAEAARAAPAGTPSASTSLASTSLASTSIASTSPAIEALIDRCQGPASAPGLPSLLDAAARLAWSELAWWHEEPSPGDRARVRRGVSALFQVNRLAPLYETAPSEPPGGAIALDVEGCRLQAAPRPDGVFGEPADWLFPPPLARRLHARGARRVTVDGATRARRERIADALVDLALSGERLAREVVLRSP